MLSVAFHSYIQTPLLFHTCSGQRPQEHRSIPKENLPREGLAFFTEQALSFHRFTSMFSLTSFLKYLVLRLKLSTHRTYACYML